MYIMYVNSMHNFSTLPIANSCLSHFYGLYVCVPMSTLLLATFYLFTFWLVMSEMLPVSLYPSRGYINFGQEFATLHRRHLRLHKVYTYILKQHHQGSRSGRLCPSVCPSGRPSVCMLQRKLFSQF